MGTDSIGRGGPRHAASRSTARTGQPVWAHRTVLGLSAVAVALLTGAGVSAGAGQAGLSWTLTVSGVVLLGLAAGAAAWPAVRRR